MKDYVLHPNLAGILAHEAIGHTTDEVLSIHSKPVSKEISEGYHVISGGFEAEDVTIIDKGILKSFMLSNYGSKKTRRERANNEGGCYVIDPGTEAFNNKNRADPKAALFLLIFLVSFSCCTVIR